MAAGWKAWKSYAVRQPPKHVLECNSINGPIKRDFQIRWIQGKREVIQERKLIQWICKITGENMPAPNVDFGEWLRNGYILCKLMNKFQPGSIKRIHTWREFAQRENVANFLYACKKLGIREEDCFTCTDLCDHGDLSLVTSTLFTLAELAHNRDRSIPLP